MPSARRAPDLSPKAQRVLPRVENGTLSHRRVGNSPWSSSPTSTLERERGFRLRSATQRLSTARSNPRRGRTNTLTVKFTSGLRAVADSSQVRRAVRQRAAGHRTGWPASCTSPSMDRPGNPLIHARGCCPVPKGRSASETPDLLIPGPETLEGVQSTGANWKSDDEWIPAHWEDAPSVPTKIGTCRQHMPKVRLRAEALLC